MFVLQLACRGPWTQLLTGWDTGMKGFGVTIRVAYNEGFRGYYKGGL